MTELSSLSPAELHQLQSQTTREYESYKSRNLKLDITRGKPAATQLDLANGLSAELRGEDFISPDGTDVRNYGGLDGLPAMKELFAAILEAPAANVIIGGNSSLQIMHDTVVRALLHGVPGGTAPWGRGACKFLCPVPGYDRHFAICEHHGVEMISIPLGDHGPDMDQIEALVAGDASIKGMWCVPKYANPTGITYSDAVVTRLAQMRTAAPDFRIFWDNAYTVHHLYDAETPLLNILQACQSAGNENRALVFGSTSKISLAGGGIAAMASSSANIADTKKHLAFQTIGPDKVNQLRHLRFFKNAEGIRAHMKKHAAIIRPKFEAVATALEKNLGSLGVAQWTHPKGGYFVSLDTLPGCASRVVKLADEAGVKLTPAGATYPYGRDPEDKNIRIAPTVPPLAQVETAMQVLVTCVKLASIEKLLVKA